MTYIDIDLLRVIAAPACSNAKHTTSSPYCAAHTHTYTHTHTHAHTHTHTHTQVQARRIIQDMYTNKHICTRKYMYIHKHNVRRHEPIACHCSPSLQ